MKNTHPQKTPGQEFSPPNTRPFIIVGRWILVAACGAGITLLTPRADAFSPNAIAFGFFGYALLSFLLANALWQHISLKKACAIAVACALLYALADEVLFGIESLWLIDILAAAIGSLVAYPLLQQINQALNSPTE